MNKPTYTAEMCDHCHQTITYLLGIDRGTVNIVKKIAKAIERKGINCVHIAKEGVLTHNELCNIIRPRRHGLVAAVKDNPGNFLLTTKGADFLNGETIPKYAIVSKSEKRQVGYFEPEVYKVNISDFNNASEYWEGINYEIREGRVVRNVPAHENQPTLI